LSAPNSSPPAPGATGSIGVRGALGIGIGGIVGGGFFATFGLGVVGARGATFISFLVGGALALLTAYAYVHLTIRYPGPGGTVSFIRAAFGGSLFAASINRLLIFSYVALMAVYARALGGYSASYLQAGDPERLTRALAAGAIILLALVNLAGDSIMDVFSNIFNVSKLGALAIFIIGGFLLGTPSWDRLGPANWVPIDIIISSGMVVFLAYEGFELIANASGEIKEPSRTLPIAYYGSVCTAIVIYVLSVIVAIGHMPIPAMAAAETFALSATAERFMGPFGFGLMTFGAVTASASAINADIFGASKLPVLLAEGHEMLPTFGRRFHGRHAASMASIAMGAVLAVYFVNLEDLSAVTSGGFLIVFAAVNYANVRLAGETKSRRWISVVATLACMAALAVMLYDFASSPETRSSAYAVGVAVLLSVASVLVFRRLQRDEVPGP
jgi:amino acid transporter